MISEITIAIKLKNFITKLHNICHNMNKKFDCEKNLFYLEEIS